MLFLDSLACLASQVVQLLFYTPLLLQSLLFSKLRWTQNAFPKSPAVRSQTFIAFLERRKKKNASCNGLQPSNDGLRPTSNGLQLASAILLL